MEKETYTEESVKALSTSRIIDLMHDNQDDKVNDLLWTEIDGRYPETSVNLIRYEFEKFQDEMEKRVSSVEDRMGKIDSFWNISNKLDMILDRLQKVPYKSQHKKP